MMPFTGTSVYGGWILNLPLDSTTAKTTLNASTYVTGTFSTESGNLAVGDFNGDGIPDLAVLNILSNTVSVLLGNGDGTFQAQQTFPVGRSPSAVAVSDFNGDGKQDLVVANYNDNTVSILLGNGDGTFQPQQVYPAGTYPKWVFVGDFNRDGKQDLVVVNDCDLGCSPGLSVLLGNGDGTFQPQKTYAMDFSPWSVAVGDVRGNGTLDLVAVNAVEGKVSVLLGNGDGTFQALPAFSAAWPTALAIGDFNGDGKADLAIAGDSGVNVLLGNGDGTFQAPKTATDTWPCCISAADFDGDGELDLIVGDDSDYTVNVLRGNGDGTFQTSKTYTTNLTDRRWLTMTASDLNGSGQTDLVIAKERR